MARMSAQETFKIEIALKFVNGRLTELRSEEQRKRLLPSALA